MCACGTFWMKECLNELWRLGFIDQLFTEDNKLHSTNDKPTYLDDSISKLQIQVAT
jgi:hypothetical protein